MESAASTLITMFEISRVGDQSRLNYKASQLPNNLYRLLAPFKKLDLQGRIDEELVKIKRQAEELAAKSPPAEPAAPPAEGSQNGEKPEAPGEEKPAQPPAATQPGGEQGPAKKDGD
jgi:hypothetical protein